MARPDADIDGLMARLAEGDRSVFTLVFTRLWEPTLRLCQSLLKNEADASDAAQEAMQKILERAGDYDSSRPAMPWALAIAAWECRTPSASVFGDARCSRTGRTIAPATMRRRVS